MIEWIKDWWPIIAAVALIIILFVVFTIGEDVKEGDMLYDRYVIVKIYDDGEAYMTYDYETKVMYDIIKYAGDGIGITPHYVNAKEVGIWR